MKQPADNIPWHWYAIGVVLVISAIVLVRFIFNG